MAIEAFAPAKINLTLHVTGRRADGYHLLDSLVVFADLGDRVIVEPASETVLSVAGPEAEGVPPGPDNLVLKAAELAGAPPAHFILEKHLPVASGLGGGSSDAAATLRAVSVLGGGLPPDNVLSLGADVPACLAARPVRMRGVGEILEPVEMPVLHAVLVNPRVAVPTPDVFARLECHDLPSMPERLPDLADADACAAWLATQRNDLQPPALAIAPVIGKVLARLEAMPQVRLVRMSGSGATCFGLFPGADAAAGAAALLQTLEPGWWVRAARLS